MTGATVLLKAENLQKTGSFKARGGLNAIGRLSAEERARGVITVSAGNHGIALSYAGSMLVAPVTVVMPETAVKSKMAAIEAYGGRTVRVDGGHLMESMEEIRGREGQVFIHPFDNPDVIAGQGTVGLELLEDCPDVEVVVVPVGGGGLISGVATAIKLQQPHIAVIGVEPEGSTAVSQSLAAGKPVWLKQFQTVADGLNAPWGGPNSLSIVQGRVDRVLTVTDDEILLALRIILERTKLLVEPAGAAAVAALLTGRVHEAEGRTAIAVLSGGNVDLSRLSDILSE